jgi:hypothetical protein
VNKEKQVARFFPFGSKLKASPMMQVGMWLVKHDALDG